MGLALLIILIVIFLAIVVFLVVRSYRRKVAAGREELIGKKAVVEVALSPKGVVLVEGERWTAVIDKGQAEPEEEVIITLVNGLELTVTKTQ